MREEQEALVLKLYFNIQVKSKARGRTIMRYHEFGRGSEEQMAGKGFGEEKTYM
jgi:hypothetical protein